VTRLAAAGRIAVVVGTSIAWLTSAVGGQTSRDILWHIVSECLDSSATGYCERCRSPVEGRCSSARACTGTTDVWGATPDYAAIRDIKMCGCSGDFVHGLALPRTRVTGVEDPRRPAGIWSYAWSIARQRIPDELEIALVINPAGFRTQDQLHVHLVRLKPGARTALEAESSRVGSLDDVWETAARRNRDAGEYGVLVFRDAEGFLVFAGGGPLERRFALGECR